MAPQMLHRVIHGSASPEPWQKATLKFQPAVLHGYRRHRVRGADYPGIVLAEKATESSSASPSSSRTSVLGTLVSGLTDGDVHRLDIYEGSEYVRERVAVRTLGKASPHTESASEPTDSSGNGDLRNVLDAASSEATDEGEEVEAVTYVWVAGKNLLEPAEWDYETFKKDKLAWWVSRDESEW